MLDSSVVITTSYLPPSGSIDTARIQADSTIGYSVIFPLKSLLPHMDSYREVAEALALQIALRLNTRVGSLIDLDPIAGAKTAQCRFRLEI